MAIAIRTVVAIDPAVSNSETSDETGIVVVCKADNGFAYVLDDLSCRASPDEWAKIAVRAYHKYDAEKVIAEINQGGDMVERVLRTCDEHISYRSIRATKGKLVRAEPVAALYEQGKVFHVRPFPDLEQQMCAFVSDGFDGSPDRVDALVYALTDLMLGELPASLGNKDFKSPTFTFGEQTSTTDEEDNDDGRVGF